MYGKPVLVGILTMAADAAAAYDCANRLKEQGVSCEVHASSASRVPNMGQKWLRGARERGMALVIATVGTSAHLVNVASTASSLPVVAFRVYGYSAQCPPSFGSVTACSSVDDVVSAVTELLILTDAKDDKG